MKLIHNFILTFVLVLCPAVIWADTSLAEGDTSGSRNPETLITQQNPVDVNSDTNDFLGSALGFTSPEAAPMLFGQSSQRSVVGVRNDETIIVLTQRDEAEEKKAEEVGPAESEPVAGETEEKTPQIPDPFAPVNKAMFQFNDKLYFWVLKPTTQVYSHIAPEPFRFLASNFYDNLWAPSRIINNLLQLRFKAAGNEFIRFLFNSFAGCGGIGDVATPALGIKKQEADFGQTLGHYGIGHGFYLVLPIIGPSSLRDGIGRVGDTFMHPFTYWGIYEHHFTFWEGVGLYAHEKVNDTSFKIGEYEAFKESAIDPYISMRDAFVQHRKWMVEESLK
jgi:phospholipid-binding lipoprotein MlaA